MSTWSVTARGASAVQVRGRNWIVALGRGLAEMGRVDGLSRLACEVLPNGTVIARDIATGTGYVVQEVEGLDGGDATEEVTRHDAQEGLAADGPAAARNDAPNGIEDPTVQGPLPRVDLSTADFSFLDGGDGPESADLAASAADPDEADEGREGAAADLDRTDVDADPNDGDGDTGDGETGAAPIFELPLDAISELSVDENPHEAIRAAETPAAACRLALDAARRAIPAEAGAVILEEKGYLRFLAVEGPAAKKLTGVRLPRGTGVAGYAIAKRKTVVLANAHDDPRHCGEIDALTGYETREICVVPVVRDDRVLGVLELMNLSGGRRFGDADLAVLEALADALGQRLSH